MMATLDQRCLIHTERETAFNVSQDDACRRYWDPFTRPAKRTDEGQVIVTAWHGMTMRVEYVSWRPPERAAILMVQGPRMIEHFSGTWIFTQCAANIVEARFRYQIKSSQGWRWLEPLMLQYFKMETKRRLIALKRYLETYPVEHSKDI